MPELQRLPHFNNVAHHPDPLDFKIAGEIKFDGKPAALSDVVSAVGERADYIMMGDTDHTSPEVLNILSSEPLFKGFAEAGCLHVCIEAKDDDNPSLQAVRDGVMPVGEYVHQSILSGTVASNEGAVSTYDLVLAEAKSAILCHQYNMQIHGVDTDPEDRFHKRDIEKFMKKYDVDLDELYSAKGDELTQMIAAAYDRAGTEAVVELSEKLSGARSFLEYRTDDSELADTIQDMTDKEKAAVIYGSGHDRVVNHLDGVFGQREMLVIDVFQNATSMDERNDGRDIGETRKGQPDFVYLAQEQRLLITDSGIQKGWVRRALKDGGFDMELENKPVTTTEFKEQNTPDLLEGTGEAPALSPTVPKQ